MCRLQTSGRKIESEKSSDCWPESLGRHPGSSPDPPLAAGRAGATTARGGCLNIQYNTDCLPETTLQDLTLRPASPLSNQST